MRFTITHDYPFRIQKQTRQVATDCEPFPTTPLWTVAGSVVVLVVVSALIVIGYVSVRKR